MTLEEMIEVLERGKTAQDLLHQLWLDLGGPYKVRELVGPELSTKLEAHFDWDDSE